MNRQRVTIRSTWNSMKNSWDNIRLRLKRKKNGISVKSKHSVRRQSLRTSSIHNSNSLRKILWAYQLILQFHLRYRALQSHIDRLLQILELQLQLETKTSTWNDYLLKNVIITGRSGTGKKSVVGECCQQLWRGQLIYYKLVDCLSFKGKDTNSDTIFVPILSTRAKTR